MRLALVTGLVSVLGIAAPAAATPVTWAFDGSVVASQVGAFPVGSDVALNWVADASAPNACASADPSVGIYFGQSLTETLGGMTYSISGILTVGTTLARGCSGAADTGVQLNLTGWSGPNALEGPLVTSWMCCSVPAMIWDNALATGAYPVLPPVSAVFQGPYFAGGRAAVSASVRALQAVPEPATLALVLAGAMLLRRRIMNA
jgi:hypothetical protein